MSIEKNLERIADALERLAAQKEVAVNVLENAAPVAETPPAPPSEPQTTAPVPETPPAPPVETPVAQPTMTPEELNNALVVEFQRLGGRDKIDAAIRELGATSITDLSADQYAPLLAKVQALPA